MMSWMMGRLLVIVGAVGLIVVVGWGLNKWCEYDHYRESNLLGRQREARNQAQEDTLTERYFTVKEQTEGLIVATEGFADVYRGAKEYELITPRRKAAFEELKLHVPGLEGYSLKGLIDTHGGEKAIMWIVWKTGIRYGEIDALLDELTTEVREYKAKMDELK